MPLHFKLNMSKSIRARPARRLGRSTRNAAAAFELTTATATTGHIPTGFGHAGQIYSHRRLREAQDIVFTKLELPPLQHPPERRMAAEGAHHGRQQAEANRSAAVAGARSSSTTPTLSGL
jgi:hypothetical protein